MKLGKSLSQFFPTIITLFVTAIVSCIVNLHSYFAYETTTY